MKPSGGGREGSALPEQAGADLRQQALRPDEGGEHDAREGRVGDPADEAAIGEDVHPVPGEEQGTALPLVHGRNGVEEAGHVLRLQPAGGAATGGQPFLPGLAGIGGIDVSGEDELDELRLVWSESRICAASEEGRSRYSAAT